MIAPTRTVFTGGHVFDARSASVSRGEVVVAEGRVVDVGPDLDGDVAVEVSGCTLLPGLFDCHVHLAFSHIDIGEVLFDPYSLQFYEAADNMRKTLALGITTVRDAGYTDAGVKVAHQRGLVRGPRVRLAIAMLSQTGGHADEWLPSGVRFPTNPGIPTTLVDGLDSARRAVRELVRAGADQIKIAVSGGGLSAHTDPRVRQLRDDELDEIIAEATAAGLDVMAHGHAVAGINAAVRAGVRSIEHGTALDEDTVALMAERGTFLVPTLSAPHGVLESAASGATLPTGAVEKAHDLIGLHTESFRRALAAGVPIAMGTDAPVVPHGRNLEELARMVAAGMTPNQAVQSATWTAARLMRLDDELGSLEPGKRADVVVLRGTLQTVEDMATRIEQVWQDGVRMDTAPFLRGDDGVHANRTTR